MDPWAPEFLVTSLVVVSQKRFGVCLKMEGRRLSRPRHCSKGVQPVPKALYRSSFYKTRKPSCR